MLQEDTFMSQSRLREYLIKAVMLTFSLIIAIGLMELVIRIFMPQSDRFVQYDPILGWRHPANSEGYWRKETTKPVRIRINSHSLRGPEISVQKAPDQFSILMLGDSFTEAFQVEETESHCAMLEQLLHDGLPGRSFQVINAGVGAYGTGQELLYFQTQGKKFRPDLVVLNMCTNDLFDEADRFSGIRPEFRLAGDSLHLEPPVPNSFLMLKIRDNLLMKMHLASFFRDRVVMLSSGSRGLIHKVGLAKTGGKLNRQNHDPQLNTRLVEALQREAHAINAAFMVFVIPPGELVHHKDIKASQRTGLHEKYLLGEFAENLRQHRIEVIDPLNLFRDHAAAGEVLYIDYAGHWTAAGHRLAAETLHNHIIQRYLPPAKYSLGSNAERGVQ
jgi:lysophospholipase L1-like esterase